MKENPEDMFRIRYSQGATRAGRSPLRGDRPVLQIFEKTVRSFFVDPNPVGPCPTLLPHDSYTKGSATSCWEFGKGVTHPAQSKARCARKHREVPALVRELYRVRALFEPLLLSDGRTDEGGPEDKVDVRPFPFVLTLFFRSPRAEELAPSRPYKTAMPQWLQNTV